MTGHSDADVVGAGLRSFLTGELPGSTDLAISGVRRSGGGSSRENWPFDVSWSDAEGAHVREMLLRRDPEGEVVASARSVEFALLKALEPTDVPAPVVHWLDASGEFLERPGIVGDRYGGRAHRALLKDVDPLSLGVEGRLALAEGLCDALAAVHAVDIAATGIDVILADQPSGTAAELEHWIGELDRQELEPQPALRFAAGWLRENLPPDPARRVLVHGDFRPANILVAGGRLEVLLDWELARTGDPLDDIGWYTTPLYRGEHFIPGIWDREDFLRRYTTATGIHVDSAALRFWEVMAMFRLAVIALTGLRVFAEGASNRPAAPVGPLGARVLAAALAG